MSNNSIENGRELTSMFCKRGNLIEYIKPGSIFRCNHVGNEVKTAKVLAVGTDSYGIPHVRYHVSFPRPNRPFIDEGPRMLALKTFADRYSERVTA